MTASHSNDDALPGGLRARLTEALAASDGHETFLAAIGTELGTTSATVHLVGADGRLHLVAHTGIPDVVLERIASIPAGKGMAGLAFERAEPVSTCNLQTDSSGQVQPGARATAMRGSIAVPIFDGDRPVGVLGVAQASEREFAPAETRLLIEAGRLVARWSEGR